GTSTFSTCGKASKTVVGRRARPGVSPGLSRLCAQPSSMGLRVYHRARPHAGDRAGFALRAFSRLAPVHRRRQVPGVEGSEAGDEQALAELIEVVTPWLLGMAQALLSDPDEAEEVVQEAFTIVWSRIGQVPNAPRGLLAWVLRTARNRAIDRLRSRKRRLWKFAHLVAKGMDGEPFAEAEEPNEAGAPGWHVHQTVHAALEALPREQRVVVRLAYFHGLTHSRIAERLGIPVGT